MAADNDDAGHIILQVFRGLLACFANSPEEDGHLLFRLFVALLLRGSNPILPRLFGIGYGAAGLIRLPQHLPGGGISWIELHAGAQMDRRGVRVVRGEILAAKTESQQSVVGSRREHFLQRVNTTHDYPPRPPVSHSAARSGTFPVRQRKLRPNRYNPAVSRRLSSHHAGYRRPSANSSTKACRRNEHGASTSGY